MRSRLAAARPAPKQHRATRRVGHNVPVKQRTRAQEVGYAGLVLTLALAAGILIWILGDRGIEAINDDRPQDAIIDGLVCLLGALIAVTALAVYAHWLAVTYRPGSPHRRARVWWQDLLAGLGTVVVIMGTVPVVDYCYRTVRAGVDELRFAAVVGYGFIGLLAIAFALFCVVRFVGWMRR